MGGRDPWLRRLTHNAALTLLLFASGGISGAGGVYFYMHGEQLNHVQQHLDRQSEEINKLSKEVHALEEASTDLPDYEEPPAFCTCISKDSGPQLVELCPAKNSVCDSESREICQTQKQNFQC